MEQHQHDLSEICGRYKVRVIQLKPVDDYYLLETNRGTKELRTWPRIDVMRWSFSWREQVARQGYRDVERFIRTRDAKPYVINNKTGYTLTDHVRPNNPFLPSLDQLETCGEIVARMHQAQLSQRLAVAYELFNKECAVMSLEEKRAVEYQRELAEQYASLSEMDEWVASQFAPLLQRMRRSLQILENAIEDETQLAVSHRTMHSHNFGQMDERMVLKGFYRPILSIQQRDAATFVRELYLATANLEVIDSFLNGYDEQKNYSYQDYLLLLGFLAFPTEPWKSIEQYFSHPRHVRNESVALAVSKTLQDQQTIDTLLQHIAVRAERIGRGRSHEPI